MITEVQRHLLTALKEIREQRLSDTTAICGNVGLWFDRERTQGRCYIFYQGELGDNISKWLEETGSGFSSVHPVGGDKQFIDELAAGTVWDNPKRWELLNWIINRLEALDK